MQEEFNQLLAGNNEKKRFIRARSRIFAILLNAKVDTAEKNQTYHWNYHRNQPQNMARTKATVRRLVPAVGSDFKRRTIYPFTIKKILPQQQTGDIKKWTSNKNNKCK